VEIHTFDVAAARTGAAFLAVGSPWTSPCPVGTSHVRTENPIPAVGTQGRRGGEALPLSAMTTAQPALKAAELPTAATSRKQYVHQTRVNAGGDGASGPHPEREPA
jgi:hypothetical protein